MAALQLNPGLLREFKVDELTNNKQGSLNKTIDSTTPTTIATIKMNIEDTKNPVWLFGTVGFDPDNASRIVFKIMRSIDNESEIEIFSALDSATTGDNDTLTTFTHVDLPPITPCKTIVTYKLTIQKYSDTDANVILKGPITFIGSEIQFNYNLVQITHTPDNL